MLTVLFLLSPVAIGSLWAERQSGEAPAYPSVSGEVLTPKKEFRTPLPSGPGVGVFLVAESHLRDPHFGRTVILIIQHSSGGSLGLIVNRPTSTPLRNIWTDLEGLKEKEDRLFIGGPVNHETFGMLYLGKKGKNNQPPIFGNVFYSNNARHLSPIASGTAGGATAFRVYTGYAGWAPGQLEFELRRGDWGLVRGFPEAIFQADPEALWADLLAESKQNWI